MLSELSRKKVLNLGARFNLIVFFIIFCGSEDCPGIKLEQLLNRTV